MTKLQAMAKLQRVHTHVRGKAEVLETLALKVLRGDEDLALALRLKAEELQRYLFRHTIWEEDQLTPMLADGASADPPRWVRLLKERRRQRLQLSRSLFALKYAQQPAANLARQCLALVESLESEILVEEREVFRSISPVELSSARSSEDPPATREVRRDRTPR